MKNTDFSTSQLIPRFSVSNRLKKILIADDDAAFLTLASTALSKLGFYIETSESGQEALSMALRCDYDAILLDAKMPDLEGFDVCARIHASLGASTPPIIMSTGLDDEHSIDKAFSMGVTDYVNKPLNWRIIGARINSLIESYERLSAVKTISCDLTNLLSASSDTVLQLNEEGYVESIHNAHLLPIWFQNKIAEHICLFDTLPAEVMSSVKLQWHSLLEGSLSMPVMISRGLSEQAFSVELSFMRSNHNGILCLIQNHTSTYLAEKEIYKLSYLDRVTGIANRIKVQEWLDYNLSSLQTDEVVIALRCQLTDYHEQESRIGQAGLDHVIGLFAQKLVDAVSPMTLTHQISGCRDASVGRMTDNEFAVLLRCQSVPNITRIFSIYLYELMNSTLLVDGCAVRFDIKVGAADSIQSVGSSHDLLENAGIALNVADNASFQALSVFHPDMRSKIQSQARLERFLRRDISNKRLDIAYQAKVETETRALVGIEALLRWHCEEIGMVSPGEFIPMAEACGLMAELSQVVIEKVLDQIVTWQKEGFSGIPVSINISGSHLETGHFVCDLLREIESRGISHRLIELEVTESIMVDSQGRAIKNLQMLRDKGIKVSVDDFGTGYSSFSYLRSLPIDCLKIDMSFVKNITHDPKSLAIARAIVTVGHDLDLTVVAEGVETEEQYQVLKEMNCDILQGYLTGRPLFSSDFLATFGADYAEAS